MAETAVEFRPLEGPASEAADCHGNQDGHLKDESDNDMSGDMGASAAANDSITVNKSPLSKQADIDDDKTKPRHDTPGAPV